MSIPRKDFYILDVVQVNNKYHQTKVYIFDNKVKPVPEKPLRIFTMSYPSEDVQIM